jgi:hypothetical protein
MISMIEPGPNHSAARKAKVSVRRIAALLFAIVGSALFFRTVVSGYRFRPERSRQEDTAALIKQVSENVEDYRQVAGEYPEAQNIKALAQKLRTDLPMNDQWGHQLEFFSSPHYYVIRSAGSDGRFEFREELVKHDGAVELVKNLRIHQLERHTSGLFFPYFL